VIERGRNLLDGGEKSSNGSCESEESGDWGEGAGGFVAIVHKDLREARDEHERWGGEWQEILGRVRRGGVKREGEDSVFRRSVEDESSQQSKSSTEG
jgi:hypothetical protein